ncbi:hypothetical protein EV174_000026 [Coemansia sp. RSA 2320]|nr:hypothetical protein EV174_000026 [Coemansia sp. RSA 2320]
MAGLVFMSVCSMQHGTSVADHHAAKVVPGGYYQQDGAGGSNGMLSSWPAGDSQHQQGCNTTDTACSSPQDAPLAKNLQHAPTSGGGGNEESVEPMSAAHPTPPQSAVASHAFSHAHNPDAWRAYHNPYHQGISVTGAYSAAAFASPMSTGMPSALDGGSFHQSAAQAAADYYYSNNGQAPPHPHQLPHASTAPTGTMPAHQSSGVADMHQLHYSHSAHQSHASAAAAGHYHHQAQDHQAAQAGGPPHYMGDYGHGMYGGGAQEIASAPASVMHLPPMDPASGLSRHNSYFSMAGSPGSSFDPMSAAAVAAAAAAAAGGGYSPHPAGQGAYMAARGPAAYPQPMMLGRFGMGMAAGPVSATPSGVQAAPSSGGASMSAPSTPTRVPGMARLNSHVQSSTSQRKRYLCTVCQKMFARPSTLSTHMHSHTGEKPYDCTWDGCGKRFSVMSNLRRHQRIHERQRAKYAGMQQQPPAQIAPGAESPAESSDGSTTPLVAQMLPPAPAPHHHRYHAMPPPFVPHPHMLAGPAQGSMPLDMHSHGLPALHHPHPHHHHHAMVSQQHHALHSHTPLSKLASLEGPAADDAAASHNGTSTASTSTVNPVTPLSTGVKE